LQHTCGSVLQFVGFSVAQAATLSRKLELVGGDIGRYAAATATVQSAISACQLMLSPSVGSLSDALGRRPLMLVAGCSGVAWHLFLSHASACSSIERYMAGAILCMGVCSAGSMSVRQASLDDVFGSRPTVSAHVASQTAFWQSITQFVAPLVGAELGRRSPVGALRLAAALSALHLPLTLWTDETLRRSQVISTSLAPTSELWITS
jgi:MFS family permease